MLDIIFPAIVLLLTIIVVKYVKMS